MPITENTATMIQSWMTTPTMMNGGWVGLAPTTSGIAGRSVHSGRVNEINAELSREATEALNASMPDVVIAAGYARIAMIMLLTAAFLAPVAGFLTAIFGPALVTVPGFVTVIVVIVLILIAVMLTALVIALRAKRAFNQLAQAIHHERHATLVRVVNRQIYVRG